jgi:uncharacterized protein YoxC
MKKFFKKYWALLVGVLLSIIATISIKKKKPTDTVIKQLDKQIDDNKQQVDIITGNIEVIEEQRNEIKSDIQQELEDLKTLHDIKENITVETPVSAKQAKQNILKKTNKGKK